MIKFNPFVVNGHPLFLPIPLTNCKHDTANSTSRTEPYPIVRRSEIVDPRVRGHVGIDHRFAPDGIPVSKLEGVKYSNPMNLHTLTLSGANGSIPSTINQIQMGRGVLTIKSRSHCVFLRHKGRKRGSRLPFRCDNMTARSENAAKEPEVVCISVMSAD